MQNIQQTIGIIGGGQLGKMMILEAKKMGFSIIVLDPGKKCPAHTLVDKHIVAAFDDKEAIRELAKITDVITYEFEHIDADVLEELEEAGYKVYPTAKSLKTIQNKYSQKELLQNSGIPVPLFCKADTLEEITQAAHAYGLPLMLKSCTGGYDGKGNYCIHTPADIPAAYEALGGGTLPLMAEKFFCFQMEISVLACRGIDGDIQVYPVAENIHHNSILAQTRVPANISQKTSDRAMALARQVMEVFEGVGMFCVEMFVDNHGDIVINEVAPRPHNSGHYTIEACVTSQFEQHIRAVAGLPLGAPDLVRPAVMYNLLGEEGSQGGVLVTGAEKLLEIPGAALHIYGKEESRPHRKMGHITIIAKSLSEAIDKGAKASGLVKISGQDKL